MIVAERDFDDIIDAPLMRRATMTRQYRCFGRSRGYNSAHNMTLWFYTFPDLARFKESALGAPEHIAIHTKVLNGLKAAGHRIGQT